MSKAVVILANGSFPGTDIPLGYLNNADRIVCCDGSVEALLNYGLEPWAIVGDMDSISDDLKRRFEDRIHHSADQLTNDLTKAVRYCLINDITDVIILGATGQREDHTVGNISLLADYSESLSVMIVSDYGFFIPVMSGRRISSWQGQQISVFSVDKGSRITSVNLKYPLCDTELKNWWMGTLNESSSDHFILKFDSGRVIVFLEMC